MIVAFFLSLSLFSLALTHPHPFTQGGMKSTIKTASGCMHMKWLHRISSHFIPRTLHGSVVFPKSESDQVVLTVRLGPFVNDSSIPWQEENPRGHLFWTLIYTFYIICIVCRKEHNNSHDVRAKEARRVIDKQGTNHISISSKRYKWKRRYATFISNGAERSMDQA